MRPSPKYVAWIFGITALWLGGCNKPCESTSQCGASEMCVASLCEELSCDKTIFAVNPASGVCTPLSGCYLTAEQLAWKSCAADPCAELDENSCVSDSRCQPAYANPNVEPPKVSLLGGGRGGDVAIGAIDCVGGGIVPPGLPPDSTNATAPGVNTGETPKHPRTSSGCSNIDNSARVYSGCRTAPQIEPQKSCESLTATQCGTRRDCTTSPDSGGKDILVPPSDTRVASPNTGIDTPLFLGQCFSRFAQPATDCASAGTVTSCLLNPACQPIGTRCYCPPGGKCSCDGGAYMGCEPNDRLRRCSSSAECRSDERCDRDEACITPRTFTSAPGNAEPGTGSCVGACVPKGCTGMGERMCNEHPECNGGSYGTVCRPKPYCANGGEDPRVNIAGPSGGACGCDSEFTGCGELTPVADLRTERSLLVRDPEIIDDPAFRIDTVFGKLAPAGSVDAFTAGLLKQVGASTMLSNGAQTASRNGYSLFLKDLSPDTAGITVRLAGLLHITALVNRLDLAKPGTCGEARLTYALTSAYSDGNQRMTLIVELRVPDDGQGCKLVAQRWAELSLIDSASERLSRLIAIYAELLKPENVGQIRTNEFLNRTGKEPWELREFHLNSATGLLEPANVAQTIDQKYAQSAELLAWVSANTAAIKDGNAVVPDKFLAASSTENGTRLQLGKTDAASLEAEKSVNSLACAGCHLTETDSPFVHIGERLGKRVGGTIGYLPVGRAVIDSFLQKELEGRAKNLRSVLTATRSLLPVHQTGLARVH